jgi:hypothetical protein
MTTLFLTGEEQKLFDGLSKELQNGWKTEEETLTYEDSDEQRKTRLQLMRFTSPALVHLKTKLTAAGSAQEVQQLIKGLQQSDITEHEWLELLYGVGPDVISLLIQTMLQAAKTDEELELVMALTALRHEILDAFVNPISL